MRCTDCRPFANRLRSCCPATPEADDTGANEPPLSGGLLRCSCMMPRMARAGAKGAAGRVALHDGDDAADDAPAALSFVKDDALYGLPQPLVGVLFWCSLVQLSDHGEVMIVQMFGLSRVESVMGGQDADMCGTSGKRAEWSESRCAKQRLRGPAT